MQNLNNFLPFTDFPPFYYLSNNLQYYTFVPTTPAPTETSTPNPEHPLNYNNFVFPSQLDQQFYYANEPHLSPATWKPYASGESIAYFLPSTLPQQQTQIQTCSSLTAIQKPDKNQRAHMLRNESSQFCNERSTLKQKQRVRNAKAKRGEQEQDNQYVPQQERKKKGTVKYHENENRNILPNEINQIFSFIQKPAKSGALLNRLLQKYPHPEHYSPKRYYQYQMLLKNRLGHYANEKSLKLVTELYEPKCESWPEEEQRYYNKISRVLIRHFLHEDCIFIILTSKRMKREKKSDHMRARRQIGCMVMSILRGL